VEETFVLVEFIIGVLATFSREAYPRCLDLSCLAGTLAGQFVAASRPGDFRSGRRGSLFMLHSHMGNSFLSEKIASNENWPRLTSLLWSDDSARDRAHLATGPLDAFEEFPASRPRGFGTTSYWEDHSVTQLLSGPSRRPWNHWHLSEVPALLLSVGAADHGLLHFCGRLSGVEPI